MQLTLATLAATLGLTLKGEDKPFTGLNTLAEATETEVTFLANPKYAPLLQTTRAIAVIVSEEHAQGIENALISQNPYVDFARAAGLFVRPADSFVGISDKAFIHPTATLGAGVTVFPFCYIGANVEVGDGATLYPGVFVGEGCKIGKQCTLYPHAVVLGRAQLGEQCVLHSGAVIGTEGFGFVRFGGSVLQVPQIGTVRLADRVEVGANSCVDRATLTATTLGNDTKVDNLVQLGHNVTVGEQCFIISQVGVAGSAKVGNRVTLAGQVGVAGHLTIGDDAIVGPQSGVAKNIAAGVTGSGSPFMEGPTYMRHSVLQPKLPSLFKRVQQLEKELAALKKLLPEE